MAAGTWTDPISQLLQSGNVPGALQWNNILNDIAVLEQSAQIVYLGGVGGPGTNISGGGPKFAIDRQTITYASGGSGYTWLNAAGLFVSVNLAFALIEKGGYNAQFTSFSPANEVFKIKNSSDAEAASGSYTVTMIVVGS